MTPQSRARTELAVTLVVIFAAGIALFGVLHGWWL